MVREYNENLRKGGSFIKTSKPLPVGREVIIEVRVPAIADDPIVIPGEVTWSSRDSITLAPMRSRVWVSSTDSMQKHRLRYSPGSLSL